MILVYFSLWIIFNGRVTLEIVIVGALISFVLDMFVKKILKIKLNGTFFFNMLKLFPDALFYVIVLLFEIIKANLSITKLILAPQIEVEPCLVRFNTPLKTHAARVALANSITLTPGTITVSLEGNEFLVHALNKEIAGGLENSLFERILKRMERRINA